MRLARYAFIAKAPGFSASTHRAELASPGFAMTVIGVGSVDEAEAAARALVLEGVQLIELCGAFEQGAADRVSTAAGECVPVGVVTFQGDAMRRLVALMAHSPDGGR